MTRQKKSRKVGQIGVRKLDARPEKPKPDTKRKKKPKGQKSGNRNSLVDEKKTLEPSSAGSNKKKDSKHGSKKAIELVPVQKAKPVEPEIKHSDKKPEVVLRKVVQNTLTPEQELAQLEQDERLIELAERVEADEVITGKDAKYFNKHMARYDELLEILGLNDEMDESELEDESDEEDSLEKLESNQWDDLLK